MSRISAERMAKAQEQPKTISKEDYAKVKAIANIVRPLRSFIFKTPDDYGMTGWRDLVIPSDDGLPLEAWYIPAKGGESDKLIIFNHALPMCRAGFPGHFGEPWSNYDGVEIDFVIQYKHLTDAGYNVLTYEKNQKPRQQQRREQRHLWYRPLGVEGLRGSQEVCRQSSNAQQDDGRTLQPVHGRQLAIRSHRQAPRTVFKNVKCMCSPLVPSMSAIFQAFSELQGVAQYQELIDLELLKMGAFPAADMTPQLFASAITMPNLTIQVRNDAWTKNPEDAQKTFDMLGTKEKEMIWVENTTRRFKDGYNYFGRYPEKVLAFFDKHMKSAVGSERSVGAAGR